MKAVIVLFSVLIIFGLTSNANSMCACPRIYLPVCGSDMETYSNKCTLNCEAQTARGRTVNLRMIAEKSCENYERELKEAF